MTAECEFHDILTGEPCCDFRCRPYHVTLPDGDVVERFLCDLHAFLLDDAAQPSSTNAATA